MSVQQSKFWFYSLSSHGDPSIPQVGVAAVSGVVGDGPDGGVVLVFTGAGVVSGVPSTVSSLVYRPLSWSQ